MKVLALTIGILTLLLCVLAPAAQAHTVTKRACIQYAWAKGPLTKPKRQARMRACMSYRAVHNACGHVRHCRGWLLVAICETGNRVYKLTPANIASIRWRYSGPGYYDGAVQFDPGTWRRVNRSYRYAYLAPPAVQIQGAERWRRMIGGDPHSTAGWPHCGAYWW